MVHTVFTHGGSVKQRNGPHCVFTHALYSDGTVQQEWLRWEIARLLPALFTETLAKPLNPTTCSHLDAALERTPGPLGSVAMPQRQPLLGALKLGLGLGSTLGIAVIAVINEVPA